MKSGVCPKCKANEVYSTRSLPRWLNYESGFLVDMFSFKLPVDEYICTACGYTERYINGQVEINRIKRNLDRIEAADAK